MKTASLLLLLSFPAGLQAAEPTTVQIVFAGDVMLDGGPGHALVYGQDPFADVSAAFQDADLVVCNLECAVVPGGRQAHKPYTFRGPKQSAPLLKRYFSAVGLANNHSVDFGKEALLNQLDLLQKTGLPSFGAGRNLEEAERPLILNRRGIKIALLAFNGFPPRSFAATEKEPGVAWLTESAACEGIHAAREKHHADLVIPYLHWGEELKPVPEESQRTLARRLIDAGADAVVGAHPHVTQTVDIHRGRPIVYSLGNLVFDYYPKDPPQWTGWIIRLTFHVGGNLHSPRVELETRAVQLDPTGLPHLLPAKTPDK
jgi:poly-gamma-glutamate capsule biosynthesis protein CapA/YwtB (metallophosphatase superfamily)